MKSLLDNEPGLKRKTVVLAVSVEPPADTQKLLTKLEKASGQTEITYLEDKDHKVIDRYGLYNPKSTLKQMPYPATLVIDRKGMVRWRFVEMDYRQRPANADILQAVKQLN